MLFTTREGAIAGSAKSGQVLFLGVGASDLVFRQTLGYVLNRMIFAVMGAEGKEWSDDGQRAQRPP